MNNFKISTELRPVSRTEPTLYPLCTPRIKTSSRPYDDPTWRDRKALKEKAKAKFEESNPRGGVPQKTPKRKMPGPPCFVFTFFPLSHPKHSSSLFPFFFSSLNSATTVFTNAVPSMKNSDASVHFESPHSPLRFRSSPLSDNGDPFHSPENSPLNDHRDNSRAIVIVETSTQFAQSAPPVTESEHRNPPPNEQPEVVVTRPARPETRSPGAGPRGRTRAAPPPTLAVPKREVMLKKVALGFRLSEVVLCLISFSVMAADKTRGWSGDSFDRYKEYRYCLSVNVIAFVYAAFQTCDLAYQVVSGRSIISHHLRYHFDFFMDQVLAYLLISSASSAATRVDDWQSNWGKDEFTEMASASIALAFLAFFAFAISSLISGYNLCTLFS